MESLEMGSREVKYYCVCVCGGVVLGAVSCKTIIFYNVCTCVCGVGWLGVTFNFYGKPSGVSGSGQQRSKV